MTFRFDLDAFKESSIEKTKKRVEAKKSQIKELLYIQEDIKVYKGDVKRSIQKIEQEIKATIDSEKVKYQHFGFDSSEIRTRVTDSLYSSVEDIQDNRPDSTLVAGVTNMKDSINKRLIFLNAKLGKTQRLLGYC